MKLVIFGAAGGTGRILVEQALAKGHEVTAFDRHPGALTIQHPKLSLVQGDVFDPDQVEAAIAGQDVVICVLGVKPGSTMRMLDRNEEHHRGDAETGRETLHLPVFVRSSSFGWRVARGSLGLAPDLAVLSQGEGHVCRSGKTGAIRPAERPRLDPRAPRQINQRTCEGNLQGGRSSEDRAQLEDIPCRCCRLPAQAGKRQYLYTPGAPPEVLRSTTPSSKCLDSRGPGALCNLLGYASRNTGQEDDTENIL